MWLETEGAKMTGDSSLTYIDAKGGCSNSKYFRPSGEIEVESLVCDFDISLNPSVMLGVDKLYA